LEVFEVTNPYVGVAITILDATGVTDTAYKYIDDMIKEHNQHPGSIGPDAPKSFHDIRTN
jgi:hypothetical protein